MSHHSHRPADCPLSPREWTMLTLVAEGLTNREIADKSSISLNTVETHLRHIYSKLGVKNRYRAICAYTELVQRGVCG